jgi:glycerophosphoryl diester phosphodiesterase
VLGGGRTVTIAIAHRGDPVGERENTLAAFAAAVSAGADMVELDLQLTRDGVVVVLHDRSVARLWGVDRAVSDLDLGQVRAIGDGDLRIPTFRQLLAEVDVPLMVDFTGPEVVEDALAAVREADAVGRSLFVSGHVGALRRVRSLAPEARIGLTWTQAGGPDLALLAELDAEFWNPMFRLVTPEHVDAVHRLGRQVSCWTVDQHRHMVRVRQAGVDAIVSNRIQELRRFLR